MRAAFYECDITPPLGGYMTGYYSKRLAQDVYDKLYAKAAVFEDNGEVAAIVVIDACLLPADIHDIVRSRVYEYTGIAPEKVCILANHTHLGAPISDSPEINCYADKAYKDVVYRLCADAIILAYKRLEDVEVGYVSATLDEDIAFNRNFELKDGTYITHGRGLDIKRPLGGIDTDLPILTIKKDGKLLGIIYSYALHQDSVFAKIPGYSGDYSSIVSKILKEKYGSDFVSMFLIGTCGDINHVNPDPNIPLNTYKHIGETVATALLESIDKTEPVGNGVKAITEKVRLDRVIPTLEEATKLAPTLPKFGRIRNLIYYVSTVEDTYTEHLVQGIAIGDLFIGVFPAEIYNEYGKFVKNNSPFKHNMTVEIVDATCGYIPAKELLLKKENNKMYETSICYYSCHVPESGEILTNKLIEIANKLK